MEHRVPGTSGFMLCEQLTVDCSADSEIVPEAIPLLLQWAQFFHGCKMTLSEIGLGMDAITGSLARRVSADLVTADFAKGATVAQGSVHRGVNNPKSRVLGGGSLMGPSSLINSACSKHSNVRFGAKYQLFATKPIKAGDTIYASYTMGDEVLLCPVCGVRIKGPRFV